MRTNTLTGSIGRRPPDHPPGWANQQRKEQEKRERQENQKVRYIKRPAKKNK